MRHLHDLLSPAFLLLSSSALVACGGGEEHGGGHDHGGHVHLAPHADEGGMLVELGDHFANVEFVLDPEAGRLTMYTLGAHASKAVRSPSTSVVVSVDMHGDAPLEVELAAQASELNGDTVGASSMFVGEDPGLVGAGHFHGTIRAINLRGEDFADVKFDYDLALEDSDGGDHDHDGEDHEGEDHEGEGHDHDGEDHDHDGEGEKG